MGDYTNSGVKIGTCGNAYYATLPMLKTRSGDTEVSYYLDPKNRCTFAFPFPQWDKKAIGDVSNFHSDQWIPFYFKFKGESAHKDIVTHLHPEGCHGVNVWSVCPQDRENEGRYVSTNMPDYDTFRLYGQCYHNETLHIVGECPYCKQLSIFTKDEAALIVHNIRATIQNLHPTERDNATEIANRIESTYA